MTDTKIKNREEHARRALKKRGLGLRKYSRIYGVDDYSIYDVVVTDLSLDEVEEWIKDQQFLYGDGE